MKTRNTEIFSYNINGVFNYLKRNKNIKNKFLNNVTCKIVHRSSVSPMYPLSGEMRMGRVDFGFFFFVLLLCVFACLFY